MCKVWRWACLSVCLPASISQKSHSNLHQICGLPFAPLRYVKHFWFPGWRHIGNGQALATQKWRTLKVTHQEQHWGEVWCLRLPCHWSPFTSSSMSFTLAELHSCAGIFSHFKVFAVPVSKWSMTLSAMSTVGTHGARENDEWGDRCSVGYRWRLWSIIKYDALNQLLSNTGIVSLAYQWPTQDFGKGRTPE